jgi:hypothetical protein
MFYKKIDITNGSFLEYKNFIVSFYNLANIFILLRREPVLVKQQVAIPNASAKQQAYLKTDIVDGICPDPLVPCGLHALD